MTTVAIVLVLLSALTHVAWNTASKRVRPTATYFFLAHSVGAMVMIPVLFWHRDILPLIPGSVWGWLAATTVFMTGYYVALAAAYRAGDMSVVYPLARSLPVVMVLVVSLLLGRSSAISGAAILGILLVSGGMLLLPKRRFLEWRAGDYLNYPCLFALLSAVGTAGYSLIDDAALRIMRSEFSGGPSVVAVTVFYSCLEGLSTMGLMFVTARIEGGAGIAETWRRGRGNIILTGLAIAVGYTLILVSLAFVRDVSYVVGFRQVAILIGVVIGVTVLKEPRYGPKFAGVVMMFAGLLLLALG